MYPTELTQRKARSRRILVGNTVAQMRYVLAALGLDVDDPRA
jgi:hypothetical protein